MPEPDDQAAQPQPSVPEDAIPRSVPTEAAVPAPAPTADNGVSASARGDSDDSGVLSGRAAATAPAADTGHGADIAFAAGAAPAADAAMADDASLAEDAGPPEEMPQGLRWSWALDFEALQAALSEPAPWNRPVRPAPPQQASSSG